MIHPLVEHLLTSLGIRLNQVAVWILLFVARAYQLETVGKQAGNLAVDGLKVAGCGHSVQVHLHQFFV